MNIMTEQATTDASPQPEDADLETLLTAFDGDWRAAIRALIIANEYLSAEVERLRASQSVGYVRGSRRLSERSI